RVRLGRHEREVVRASMDLAQRNGRELAVGGRVELYRKPRAFRVVFVSAGDGCSLEDWAPGLWGGSRSEIAGPETRWPRASKREPWHRQSHVFSAAFQCTGQPRCVQAADISCTTPVSSRYTATLCSPRRRSAPSPGSMSSTRAASPFSR